MLQSKQLFNNSKFQQISGDTISLSGSSLFSKIVGLPNLTIQTNNATGATSNTILDTTFIQGSGFDSSSTINFVKYQANGKMLVAGNFIRYNSSFNNRIIRFNTD